MYYSVGEYPVNRMIIYMVKVKLFCNLIMIMNEVCHNKGAWHMKRECSKSSWFCYRAVHVIINCTAVGWAIIHVATMYYTVCIHNTV